eukprot:m.314074 g.314074  ORF g.314074 m.314074 type:complete len:837 (+) comp15969_c0_seq2:341-2851(+)
MEAANGGEMAEKRDSSSGSTGLEPDAEHERLEGLVALSVDTVGPADALADRQAEISKRSKRWSSALPDSVSFRKRKCIGELIATEQSYLADLKAVRDGYFTQIPTEYLSASERVTLFLNLTELCDFHSRLFTDMQQLFTDSPLEIATVFVDRDFLSVYTPSCTRHDKQLEILNHKMATDEGFCAQLEKCQELLGHRLPLKSYLLIPVQRIMRYKLLLSEQLKYTEEGDLGHALLVEAIHNMEYTTSELNELTRQAAVKELLYGSVVLSRTPTLRNRLNSLSCPLAELGTLVAFFPACELITDGRKSPRMLLCFRRGIIACKERDTGGKADGSSKLDVKAEYPFESFEVKSVDKFKLALVDRQQKEFWDTYTTGNDDCQTIVETYYNPQRPSSVVVAALSPGSKRQPWLKGKRERKFSNTVRKLPTSHSHIGGTSSDSPAVASSLPGTEVTASQGTPQRRNSDASSSKPPSKQMLVLGESGDSSTDVEPGTARRSMPYVPPLDGDFSAILEAGEVGLVSPTHRNMARAVWTENFLQSVDARHLLTDVEPDELHGMNTEDLLKYQREQIVQLRKLLKMCHKDIEALLRDNSWFISQGLPDAAAAQEKVYSYRLDLLDKGHCVAELEGVVDSMQGSISLLRKEFSQAQTERNDAIDRLELSARQLEQTTKLADERAEECAKLQAALNDAMAKQEQVSAQLLNEQRDSREVHSRVSLIEGELRKTKEQASQELQQTESSLKSALVAKDQEITALRTELAQQKALVQSLEQRYLTATEKFSQELEQGSLTYTPGYAELCVFAWWMRFAVQWFWLCHGFVIVRCAAAVPLFALPTDSCGRIA